MTDPISRREAKEAIKPIWQRDYATLEECFAALDKLPALDAPSRIEHEPKNMAEVVKRIIELSATDAMPDFVSDLNPTDEQAIRDSRLWFFTIGQLRAICKQLEAK